MIEAMRLMPSIHLTDKGLRSLTTDKSYEDYWDQNLKGFVVRVFKSGAKRFEVIYRTEVGRRGRFKIGDAKLLGLADARIKARQVLVEIEKGADPSQRKKDSRAADTFSELAESYVEYHAKPHLKPRSIRDIQYGLKSELLPAWRHRKVKDISRKDVISLIESIGIKRHAPVRANHIRALITGIFTFALQRDVIETSPCVGLPRKYRETPRERTLTDDEIKKFWDATEKQQPVIRDLFRALLLLGQRSGETRGMRWQDIRGGVWTIPSDQAKNNREHQIPLPLQVIDIIDGQKNESPYVFSSPYGGSIKWIQKANCRLIELMNAEDTSGETWRVHDLRRTCATGLERLQVPEAVVSSILNHSKIGRLGVTGRYTQHDYLKEKKQALETWVSHVFQVVSRK